MRESELDRCKEEAKAPRKPFTDLTNRHYPLRGLDRAGVPGCFPDVATAAGLAGLCLPSVRTAQVNRRVASDPLPGKERRKFLDPIKEAENESACEEIPAIGPRVRFRSKSVAVLPQFLNTRGHTPTTGDSNLHDQVEDPSPEESTFSILGVPAEGDVTKGIDDGMNTDESHRGSEASHSPPPSPTLRQAASDEPTRRVKSVIDTLVPESHSTPAAVKFNAVPRHASSPPIHLTTSEPPCHPFDSLPTKGIEMPRPMPFNTFFLPPQTHKVARGQLVVLPSRTLLVDFREGERRQGRQGVEVLTISPGGEEVNINPHVTAISKLNPRSDPCVQRSAHEQPLLSCRAVRHVPPW